MLTKPLTCLGHLRLGQLTDDRNLGSRDGPWELQFHFESSASGYGK